MYNYDTNTSKSKNRRKSRKKRKLNKARIFIFFLLIFLLIFAFGEIKNFHSTEQPAPSEEISEKKPNNKESKKKLYLKEILAEREARTAREAQNSKMLTDAQLSNIQGIYRLGSEKTVYLTFDDGPSNTVTPLILDVLKEQNVKATFFLLGANVEAYPELVQREYAEGHYLANHGYSHRYSEIYKNKDTIYNDYLQCNTAIQNALGNKDFLTKVYRFPGGSTGGTYNNVKSAGKTLLNENHIAYLDWNALTRDAEGTPTHESILKNLEDTVGDKDNVVLLMHDSSTKILTYETLPEVISFFKDRGYTFKNLYDVLELSE